jgi:hypothetical protein
MAMRRDTFIIVSLLVEEREAEPGCTAGNDDWQYINESFVANLRTRTGRGVVGQSPDTVAARDGLGGIQRRKHGDDPQDRGGLPRVEATTGGDEALGIVDFSIFPHVDHPALPENTMAAAERWATNLR